MSDQVASTPPAMERAFQAVIGMPLVLQERAVVARSAAHCAVRAPGVCKKRTPRPPPILAMRTRPVGARLGDKSIPERVVATLKLTPVAAHEAPLLCAVGDERAAAAPRAILLQFSP